ncbi:asparaginase domain-containing protein [Conexibacter woesei]|uniref:1-alkyl-2-acetylglycerophosphocholine esterase n=1 Tax=Conexibacter woesei (strain DSM 14684 / CCUG 47730 / CIP 108061 / JCM 11494 / NBRC 100937 / ID131577) TaxID=469383 RepID=D3F548_CONWI|nr:asparaginase domain-containing protein [Conexibacter woesei]ADB48626.1 1-alkyl-2-acetylglycerophosphocholine esterase [Conexibacter woesei DSM 14684]
MPEIFFSYAHLDNELSEDNTHQFTDAVDHFRRVYTEIRKNRARPLAEDELFFDQHSIRDGDLITKSTTDAAKECLVMLAFFSPNYFGSEGCRAEWRAFNDEQKRGSAERARKLLIPIEVRPVDDVQLADEEGREWFTALTTADGLRRNITSEILLAKDTGPLYAAVEQLDKTMDDHVTRVRGSSRGTEQTLGNVLVVKTPIRRNSLNDPAIAEDLTDAPGMKWDRLDPVCVVYAGGTVGMVHQQDSDELHADYEMAAGVDTIVRYLRPKIAPLPFNIHFFSLLQTIDSSNVTAANWVDLATLLQEQMSNYQGFVILHGTNTLAYTASALSFLLSDSITQPVILTGAEVPLSVSNTDAVHNVEHAIRTAAHQAYNGPVRIPEVCVYWNNQLFRGNRVTKKYASDRTASFHTPNMPVPLGTLANDRLAIDYEHVRRTPPDAAVHRQPQPIHDIAKPRVEVMFIHPDMDFSDLEARFPPEMIDGLILLSYGPGNAPEDRDFLSMLDRLLSAGTIVVNITQCPYGRVELKLFETAATLFDLGVVDGYDMTLEAAYTKLLWAIARHGNRKQPGVREEIRKKFQRCVAGEMSASVYTVSFGPSQTFHPHDGYLVSDIPKFDGEVDRHDITEVFLRLESLKLPRDVTTAKVRVLFGRPPDTDAPEWAGNVLAEFTKTITAAERAAGEISKNLEITHPFRKCFRNEGFDVSLCVEGIDEVEFTSLSVVIYTTAAWGRGK